MAANVNIPAAVRKSYEVFCQLKGKSSAEFPSRFWDLVVLTASDPRQQQAFQEQIEQKLKRGEIPRGVPYHVFPDPPGAKAGCGTSTMNVICLLKDLYGEKLLTYRVLLLNCGGQSQRLASSSILGKVFMVLPLGSPPLSLFEYKLFCFMPLISKMAPGYMHVPADTIEVYDLGGDCGDWTMDRPGFTALAHPSSLEIGSTHGVFVLGNREDDGVEKATEMAECTLVLQKPTEDAMRRNGAVLKLANGDEFVYSDSNFFFDHNVADKLEALYRREAPLDCEIDGYGDFLRCLGPKATGDFIQDTRNVRDVSTRLIEVKKMVFETLKDTPLNILAMNASKFYHLGTMNEYIDHFCTDGVLAEQMGFEKQVFCQLTETDHSPRQKRAKVQKSSAVDGTLIQCILPKASVVSSTTVMEFCEFTSVVQTGADCIISSCSSTKSEDIVIPSGTFLHTVAVRLPKEDRVQYVTVAFQVADDIKKSVPSDSATTLPYFKRTIGDFCIATSLDISKVFKQDALKCNLWNARVFCVCDSMTESFDVTLKVLKSSLAVGSPTLPCDISGHTMASMEDVLEWKHPRAMIEFRQTLCDRIEDALS